MTQHEDEILSRYLDGEMPAGERADLESRLAAEPALAARLRSLQAVDELIQAAAQGPGSGEAPAATRALLERRSAQVIPLRPTPVVRRAAGLAIAASVVAAAGLLLAPQWRQADDADLRAQQVAEALETSPSSAEQWVALGDGARLRPVLSFATAGGEWCREYQLASNSQQWRGVACRAGDAVWHTEVLVAEAQLTAGSDSYQPAGADDVDAVSGYIASHAADIPLNADQEARLIARDWQ